MKTEQQLQAQIDALAKDIEPGRDLWPELAARLATTPQLVPAGEIVTDAVPQVLHRSERSGFWWAGGMAAAVLLSVLLWPQGADVPVLVHQAPAVSAQPVPSQSGDDNTTGLKPQAPSQVQWQLTSDFEIQRAALLAQVQQVPEFYQDWQQQLAIWQQARSQVLLALSYQPDEPVLLRQLSQLQQQQMHYLQKLVSVELTYSGVTS
jgi:hypothetical protein